MAVRWCQRGVDTGDMLEFEEKVNDQVTDDQGHQNAENPGTVKVKFNRWHFHNILISRWIPQSIDNNRLNAVPFRRTAAKSAPTNSIPHKRHLPDFTKQIKSQF